MLLVLQPRSTEVERFGLFPVRSPLLGESLLISFPTGTEMFQFPAFAPPKRLPCMTTAGLPHSEIPGLSLACQLPGAYRRLLRPSSPPDAKASTVRPLLLDHQNT